MPNSSNCRIPTRLVIPSAEIAVSAHAQENSKIIHQLPHPCPRWQGTGQGWTGQERTGLEQTSRAICNELLALGLSFQYIWRLQSENRDVTSEFRERIESETPLFVNGAGYSNGGKTHSLLLLDMNSPPALQLTFTQGLGTEKELRVVTNG